MPRRPLASLRPALICWACLVATPAAADSILDRVLSSLDAAPTSALLGLYVNRADNVEPAGDAAQRIVVDGSIAVTLHSETPPDGSAPPEYRGDLRLTTSSIGANNAGSVRVDAPALQGPAAVVALNGASNRGDVQGHVALSGPAAALPASTISTTAIGASNSAEIVITLRGDQLEQPSPN